jgi:hypothetical protein
MPSPREIAKQKNDPSKFDGTVESYDAEAGTPAGVAPQGRAPDYAANPTNPPDPPPPAKNLKR